MRRYKRKSAQSPQRTASRCAVDSAGRSRTGPQRLLPLGALAAGFGMLNTAAWAQLAPAAPAPAASAPAARPESTMAPISVKATVENDANSLRATTTTIGKGEQELRDIPQSITVVTERLMEERRVDTLDEALRLMGGISFLAAEGGEEDIRLRGFSLAAGGDIFVDSLRDPAFYDRDVFGYERIELLRGSASMLFGRGSTGGVVNQVSKMAFLDTASVVNLTAGTGRFGRFTGDFNIQTSDDAGLRINLMKTVADNWGNSIDKEGLQLNYRWGIGTSDEFYAGGYYLHNDNGINYGLPWLRASSTQTGSNPSVMIPGLDPKVYYGAPSDYNEGSAGYGTLGWAHRFSDGGMLKSAVRYGQYDRDQRASTIRFCQRNGNNNPDCPTTPQGVDTVNDATILTRGTNNKVQDMNTAYAQMDYSNNFNWFGVNNALLTGIDLAHEEFSGYAMALPDGVVLNKNSPRTTIGTPDNDYGWVDEALRIKRQQAAFDARAVGVYAQDLVQVAPDWKVLLGLRYDYFRGSYQTFQTTTAGTNPPPLGTVTADRRRSDGEWSERFGVLYQPSELATYYFSYGTSFNTSGDTYQYDLPGSNTPPESSRNLEIGAKIDLASGQLSTRFSIFNITKFNERNRDSPAGTPLVDYLLSGERHATGLDVDIAGRITPQWSVFVSYTWIPDAKIDAGNADGTTLSGEQVGQRPSLTPRNSGSFWTTYQVLPALLIGGGITGRSSQTPNRNPPGIVAPSFVTGDLMAEYNFSDAIGLQLNVLNVTNKYYADSLYTGHYIQGAPRSVQATLTMRF